MAKGSHEKSGEEETSCSSVEASGIGKIREKTLLRPGRELATTGFSPQSRHTGRFTNADPSVNPPKIILRLPDTSSDETPIAGPSRKRTYDTSGIPDEYSVNVPAERAKNTFVFTQRPVSHGREGVKGVDAWGQTEAGERFVT